MAISSYKAIAKVILEHGKLDLVLNSMNHLVENGHDILFNYIQEIENAFAERTYKPLSVDEIVGLE